MLHFKLFLKMKNYLPRIIFFNPDLHALLSPSLSVSLFARRISVVLTPPAVRQRLA